MISYTKYFFAISSTLNSINPVPFHPRISSCTNWTNYHLLRSFPTLWSACHLFSILLIPWSRFDIGFSGQQKSSFCPWSQKSWFRSFGLKIWRESCYLGAARYHRGASKLWRISFHLRKSMWSVSWIEYLSLFP